MNENEGRWRHILEARPRDARNARRWQARRFLRRIQHESELRMSADALRRSGQYHLALCLEIQARAT